MPIRAATDDHVAVLLPLFRAYCEFYDSHPADEGLEAMIRHHVAASDDEAFILVADEGDELVGFAACNWKWSSLRGARIVFLDDLFVRPESRGEGHADALIAACAEIGRRGGAPAMSWLTAHDNHRAQAVYDRVGGKAESFLEYELEL